MAHPINEKILKNSITKIIIIPEEKTLKAFMAIKFHEGEKTKKIIDDITNALAKVDIHTYLLVRDVEQYGKVEIDEANIMPTYAFPGIKSSDIMLIEFSEKGVGLGIGAGFAYANGVPIYIIAKTGSDISVTMNSLAEKVIFYDKPDELTDKFGQLISNNQLKTKN